MGEINKQELCEKFLKISKDKNLLLDSIYNLNKDELDTFKNIIEIIENKQATTTSSTPKKAKKNQIKELEFKNDIINIIEKILC